jgi:hypothetical protein
MAAPLIVKRWLSTSIASSTATPYPNGLRLQHAAGRP